MKDDLVFETAKMPKNTHYTIITLNISKYIPLITLNIIN